MKKNGYIFEVGELVNADHGTRINVELNESDPVNLDGGIELIPPLKADVVFMKMDDAIHVNLENISAKFDVVCSKCITKFKYLLKIPQAERVYYFEKQFGEDMDDLDTFYVDKKKFLIDLKEFLRQEIILHFPQVPVCLKSCKGLCSKCGKNLNKTKCGCVQENIENKPLAALKKLYNK